MSDASTVRGASLAWPGTCRLDVGGRVGIVLLLLEGHVRITAKGQVTIPQDIRRRLGLLADTEVQFKVVGNAVEIRRAARGGRRGRTLLARMRGKARTTMTTDEIMSLTRG